MLADILTTEVKRQKIWLCSVKVKTMFCEKLAKLPYGFFLILYFLIVSIFSLSTGFAQYEAYTQFSLPEGAKVRFGKGLMGDLKYSPDGTVLTVAGPIGIWLYDATNGEELALLTDHTNGVDTLVFRHDGLTLTSASYDGDVHLWDPTTGAVHQIRMERTDGVSGVSFAPDGSILAGIIRERKESSRQTTYLTIRLWDVMTGKYRTTLIGHTDDVREVVFSPDGTILASGGKDRTIRLWNVVTGALRQILIGHTDRVTHLAFSPDSSILASSSSDGTLRLWDVATETHLQTLTGHTDTITEIAFSPNGTILAGGVKDGTICLWDAATGKHQGTIAGHTESVTRLVFLDLMAKFL